MAFWFEFGSTYSYLSACRIEALAEQAGVDVEWRPFLLGPIFTDRGWNTSPFSVYPDKGLHMWRDMGRRAAVHALPFRRPTFFPQNGLLASRVMLVGLDEGWGAAFAKAVYRAEFVQDQPIADVDTLAPLIEQAGGNAHAVLARTSVEAIKSRLRSFVDEARQLGVFGAPTFVCRGELFWGDDRLEEALLWCCGSHPAQSMANP